MALPAAGSGAGVLVLYAWWGLRPCFKQLCDRLAQAGYVAVAPDLFHGTVATTVEAADQLSGTSEPAVVCAEILAAVQYLQAHPAVTSPAIGVIGCSFGAFYALWLAQQA